MWIADAWVSAFCVMICVLWLLQCVDAENGSTICRGESIWTPISKSR